MYIAPLFLTFISFLISILFGKYIGTRGTCFLTSSLLLFSLLTSTFIYYEVVVLNSPSILSISDWFYVDLIHVSWLFYYDSLTATMLLVVTFISFCAHLYSIEYMNSDPHQVRFMSYLSLFTFFMLILITSGNIIQLFVGWEGVGICSYLLINFWYTRLKANKSAIMAVLANRIGDLSLLISFGFIVFIYKSFDFDILFAYTHSNYYYDHDNIFYHNLITKSINLLLIIGAVGKSAQVGLHIWLPEAMEGPTPVSSLIHAATMVTAGIFLIIRCSYLFEVLPETLLWIVFIGSITTFFASSIGVVQNDLKKIIAYSTCSQLGYMFLACGLSGYNYSLFHLFNHAFFKALLFLTAGYIIHSLSNEQDIRKMGLLYKFFPISNIMILYASLSLIGFDFTSGYYSKDKIIEIFYNRYSMSIMDDLNFNLLISLQFLSTIAIYCTLLYSVKLSTLVFFGFNLNSYYNYISSWSSSYEGYFIHNNKVLDINNMHYGNVFIYVPLFFLFLLSIISGFLFKDIMIGEGLIYWNESFFISNFESSILNSYSHVVNYEYNEYFKGILHQWVLYILFVSIYIYYTLVPEIIYFTVKSSTYLIQIKKYLVEKYIIINKLLSTLSYFIFNLSYNISYILIDKGILERFGPFGIFRLFSYLLLDIRKTNLYYTSNLFKLYLVGFFSLLLLFI